MVYTVKRAINTESEELADLTYIVDDNNLRITKKHLAEIKSRELSWKDLILPKDGGEGVIEYIDANESNVSMIVMSSVKSKLFEDSNLESISGHIKHRFTHCEIHPSTALGVLASIPFRIIT